jgi:hypothetical protein
MSGMDNIADLLSLIITTVKGGYQTCNVLMVSGGIQYFRLSLDSSSALDSATDTSKIWHETIYLPG